MPYKDPEKRRACARRYNATHPEVVRKACTKWRAAHPEQCREMYRQSRARRKEAITEYNRQYAIAHKDVLREKAAVRWANDSEKMREKNRQRRTKHREEYNNQDRKRRSLLRAQFFALYGSECVRCGLADPRFLTISHKANDGKRDKRENGGHDGMLRRAIAQPDIKRYETMCYNCNHIEWLNHSASLLTTKTYVDNSEKFTKTRICGRQRHAMRRSEMFKTYGSACACCGESDTRILVLSHRGHDGAHDRRENGNSTGVLALAIKHPDHAKYEILCWNCNCGTAFNGGGICPHKIGAAS